VDVGGEKLASRHVANPLDELRILGRAEADVVGKHRRAANVVVSMYRVDAIEQRYSEPALERLGLDPSDHLAPGLRVVWGRIDSSPAQD